MMSSATLSSPSADLLSPKGLKAGLVGFFRYRAVNGRILLTNNAGDFTLLDPPDFQRFLQGELPAGHPQHSELFEKGFIPNEQAVRRQIEKTRDRLAFLGAGPGFHIVIATLRCNQACHYCHATAVPAKERDFDMTLDTAKKVVDCIFASPSRGLTIEFQGGEPTLNWDVIQFISQYSIEKANLDGRTLGLAVVTNFTSMNDEKLQWLVDHKVNLCTSIDGPRDIHDRHRGTGTYDRAVKWLRKAQDLYAEKYPTYRPAALTTITRHALERPREVVDEYVGLGMEGIHLRSVHPLGFAHGDWQTLGYTMEEFMAFWRAAVDYMLELNLKGRFFFERMASILLQKILSDQDPNYVDLRSPTGSGLSTLTYNFNGAVYAADEGRMLSMMGDEAFLLGDVRRNNYREIMSSPTLRALAVATVNDALPGCSVCTYKPYCGLPPWYNYAVQGTLHGRQFESDECKMVMGICDYLFTKWQDPTLQKVLVEWIRQGVHL